jgi:hypothetical protein
MSLASLRRFWAMAARWKPARRAQIDRDGRLTIKRGKQREAAPGNGHSRQVEIAVPVFGYKNHIGIDREHGFLRRYAVTHAAAYDGAQLGAVLDRNNTASDVGRHRLSVDGQSRPARPPQTAIPAQKAPGQEKCRRISLAAMSRAPGSARALSCLCRPEMPPAARYPQRRLGARSRQDRPRQSPLQLYPAGLARSANCIAA